jgi:Ca2+-transporting ATPase
MGFVVMGLGTAVAGFTLHRSPGSAFWAPVLRPAALSLLGVVIMFGSTELPFLQSWLNTVALTGSQWLACLGLAVTFGAVIEIDKAWQRHPERTRV